MPTMTVAGKAFEFPTAQDAAAYVASVDAKELAARRAFELANMSPHIKPAQYAACITQTMLSVEGTLVTARDKDAKPLLASAVNVTRDPNTGDIAAKTPIVWVDPKPEATPVGGEAEAIK